MAKVIDGKAIAAKIRGEITAEVTIRILAMCCGVKVPSWAWMDAVTSKRTKRAQAPVRDVPGARGRQATASGSELGLDGDRGSGRRCCFERTAQSHLPCAPRAPQLTSLHSTRHDHRIWPALTICWSLADFAIHR